MPVSVGVYTRISDDGEGDAKGVARQQADCFGLTALRRWEPVLYEENDISAFKKSVRRDRFEAMLADLSAGVIQGVVVYNVDRLARQPRDLERLIDIYDDHPAYVFATLEGDINLATSDGRTMARVMVAFANKSSADTGRRIKRKQLELAAEGKLHGGRIPWGWQADGVTSDPEAKKEILAAHRAVLDGTRISEIRADWEARDIVPVNRHGKRYPRKAGAQKIYHHTVHRILTNPALAGLKVYQGQMLLGEDGAPVRAVWDPICTPEQLDAVVAVLDGRAGPSRHLARRYLLSGIAACGLCGRPLRGSTRKHKDKIRQYSVYQCDTASGGCGKITRIGTPVEELVIDLVLMDQARKAGSPDREPSSWEGEQLLEEVLEEITELHEAKKAKQISISSFIRALRPLEEERDRLQAEKRRHGASAVRHVAATASSRDDFDAFPLEGQRELILNSLQAVVVHPASRRGAPFDPDLIEPVWAE